MFTQNDFKQDEITKLISEIIAKDKIRDTIKEAYNKELGIDSVDQLKEEQKPAYFAEIDRRMSLPEGSKKKVSITEDTVSEEKVGKGYRVSYISSDRKSHGSNKFSSREEAIRFINSIRKNKYHGIRLVREDSMDEASKFGQAFRDARARGDKEFNFGGKRYHTRQADETPGQHERNRQNTVSANRYAAMAKSGQSGNAVPSANKSSSTPTPKEDQKGNTGNAANAPQKKVSFGQAVVKASAGGSASSSGSIGATGNEYNNPHYNKDRNDRGPAHPSRATTRPTKDDGATNPNPKVGKLGTPTSVGGRSLSDRARGNSVDAGAIARQATSQTTQSQAVKGIRNDAGKPGSQTILGIKPQNTTKPTPVPTTKVSPSQVSPKKIPGSAPILQSGSFR